jgi:hypothetical protein
MAPKTLLLVVTRCFSYRPLPSKAVTAEAIFQIHARDALQHPGTQLSGNRLLLQQSGPGEPEE